MKAVGKTENRIKNKAENGINEETKPEIEGVGNRTTWIKALKLPS